MSARDLGSHGPHDADLFERNRAGAADPPDPSDWAGPPEGSTEPLTGAWAEGMEAVQRFVSTGVLVAVLVGLMALPAAGSDDQGLQWRADPVRTVCVEDHTGRRWEVRRAVRHWREVAPDQLRLRYSRDCRRTAVTVDAAWMRHEPRWAWARQHRSAAGNLLRVDVRLNNTRVRGYGQLNRCLRRTVLSHELGHALGLGHNSRRQSAMSREAWWVRCGRPDPYDRWSLRVLYGSRS